jgi:hypothetical protein
MTESSMNYLQLQLMGIDINHPFMSSLQQDVFAHQFKIMPLSIIKL